MFKYRNKRTALTAMVGQTVKDITGLEKDSGEVRIFTEEGNEYLFFHSQDCCESVALEDFELSAVSLDGGVIISAEEIQGSGPEDHVCYESCTWTFYKVETTKGGLWMRWLGESNGYYSESVDFVWVNKPEVH